MKPYMIFVLTQKLRIDLAASFLVFVNFGLLIITASDKINNAIATLLGKEVSTYVLVSVMFVLLGGGAWILGYVLDKKFKYIQAQSTVGNERNPQICEIIEREKKLEKELCEIKNMLRYQNENKEDRGRYNIYRKQ